MRPHRIAAAASQVTPEIGITSTPVIDRNAGAHGTIYIISMTRNAAGSYFQRLHALDLTTGVEQFSGPRDVAASYPGTGDNSANGSVFFDPKQYKERPGFALSNGVIYTTWSSHCDIRPYTSWVIGYDQLTLTRVSVLNLTPNGTHGAIWASGAAPAVDANGNLFALTGDGTFETTLNTAGFPNRADFGNCMVKLATPGRTLSVADYFTMFNTVAESAQDADLGSGGVLLLPDMVDANGITRHLSVGAGKDGHIYLVNRDNMGKFVPNATSNSYVYQDVPNALGGGVFASPAYFNGRLYYGAVNATLKALQFTSARLGPAPVSLTTTSFSYPGTTPGVSSNGSANGIVWAAENGTPAVLHAYSAANLSELYNSNQAANGRDQFGAGNKFIVPTVANGKVYVGTTNSVAVFGLFNPPRLGNISARANVGTGNNVLIGGFVVQGGVSKRVVLRGLGPSLKINGTTIPGALQNPVLELRDRNGALIASNDDWQTNNPSAAQIQTAGLAPGDPAEAAILRTLAPDAYTIIIFGRGGTTGLGLVELYDLSTQPTSTVANLSARAAVGTGDDVLIGGLVVFGLASQTVLFRAIGPELANFGIAGPLQDPVLELRNQNGALVASNDNWRSTQQVQITATGLQPANDRDSAILATLAPAAYTAIVHGGSNGTGIALVEAYAIE